MGNQLEDEMEPGSVYGCIGIECIGAEAEGLRDFGVLGCEAFGGLWA